MQFSSALTAVAIHSVVLLSPTEWAHIHVPTCTEEDRRHNRQKIGSVFTWGWEPFSAWSSRRVCLCVYLSVLSVSVNLIENVHPRGSLLIHTVWILCAFWSLRGPCRPRRVQPITSSRLYTYTHTKFISISNALCVHLCLPLPLRGQKHEVSLMAKGLFKETVKPPRS